MANKRTNGSARERYGVEAELERLLSCPECGSARVRPTRAATTGYGVFGFKAIGDMSSPRQVVCRSCGAEWLRPPIRELRLEAERRIDERSERFSAENRRLLAELERDRLNNFAPVEDPLAQPSTADIGSMEVTPDGRSGDNPAN